MLLVGKNCTLWPQTALDFFAVLHERIKTNIHLISINAFQKYEQYFLQNCFIFFIWLWKLLWISVFSVVNNELSNINNNKKPSLTQEVFFFHLSIIFRHVSLINTETLNLKQFWICVKLGQVYGHWKLMKLYVYLTLNKLHSLSGSRNSWPWVTKQYIQHLQ